MLGPSSLIFSGYVGVICGSAYFKNHLDRLRYKKVLLVHTFGDPKKGSKNGHFLALNGVYMVFGVKIKSHGMAGEVRRAF